MAILDYTIDKTVPIPLYFQLKSILLTEIEQSNIKTGEYIPTEKELGEIFQISRTTVRQAITELVQEGRLLREKSKGTYVTKPKIEQKFIKRLESFNEQILRMGKTPSTKVLEFSEIPVPASFSQAMELKIGEHVIYLNRLRFIDNEPNVYVRTYMPYSKCSFILQHDLEEEDLYSILSQYTDTKISKVSRVVEAVPADAEDAKLLGVKPGQPIHSFITKGYNANNNIVEFSLARYRGDRNRFEVEVYVDTGSGE